MKCTLLNLLLFFTTRLKSVTSGITAERHFNYYLLQPLGWRCIECAIHHGTATVCARRITPICMWREHAIIDWSWRASSADTNMWTIERSDQRTRRVIMACDLYCCLLPQCEALRTCHSVFPIATVHIKGVRRGGLGLTPPPWAWYFTKILLPSQGD